MKTTLTAIGVSLVTLFLQPVYGEQIVPRITGAVDRVITPLDSVVQEVVPIRDIERDIRREVLPSLESVATPISQVLTTSLSTALSVANQPIAERSLPGGLVLKEVQTADGFLALEREWVVTVKENELAELTRLPVKVLQKRYVSLLDKWVVRLSVSEKLDTKNALQAMFPQRVTSQINRNVIYLTQGGADNAPASRGDVSQQVLPQVQPPMSCRDEVSIGMLDTAIATTHPYFAGLTHITEHSFLDSRLPASSAHGTAVAGVLRQSIPSSRRLSLFSAAVFYSRNEVSQGASLFDLLSGLDWLSAQPIHVINMSLTGPDNPLLAQAMAQLHQQGLLLVAAVGNAGPAAPTLYPAGYKNVLGVTAVDKNQQIYRWANQGEQVFAAALGVAVNTARGTDEEGPETGTSMASPAVAAKLACSLSQSSDNTSLEQFKAAFIRDVGPKGWDPIFGFGLVE